MSAFANFKNLHPCMDWQTLQQTILYVYPGYQSIMSFFKKLFKSEPSLLVAGEEPQGPLPRHVLMKTNFGDIELDLHTEQTPKVSHVLR